jgi:hypothetical protein
LNLFSKPSPKPEKGKPKKVQAPSNINKMDTNGLDYTKKADAGKENIRTTPNAPITARPEQGDLKTMAVEYVQPFKNLSISSFLN